MVCLHIEAWRQIGTSPVVLNWIKQGVNIPLHNIPEPFDIPNPAFNEKESAFIDSEIYDLLTDGVIQQCVYNEQPKYVSPIGCVPKKNGKLRLIHNLRHFNTFCDTPSYRNEDIRTVCDVIRYKDYLVSLDIKSGFYHVPVAKQDRDFLCFRWRNVFYKWNVLPFGLSCSPYYFSKFLRPIVTYLRSLGLRVVVYVDDFILMCRFINFRPERFIGGYLDRSWYPYQL